MEAHRIAVMSDTHGLLRPECVSVLETCEAVLHAGDVGKPEVLERLREKTLTYAVRGNVDREWAEALAPEIRGELYGFRFYMVHDKKQIREELTDVDIVVYGHSHKYEMKKQGRTVYLNPGSCGGKRFRLPVTMAVLTLYPGEHRLEIERVECLSEISGETEAFRFPEKDMDRLIRRIVKEMKAGRNVENIAFRLHADRALVEQVCRICLTHPGVDVDGILNRMELKDL